MLVEKSIGLLAGMDAPVFCDVGVGSGCIAISVLHHVPSATAIGLDISDAALAVTRRNAQIHDVHDRLRLLHSDVFSGLKEEHFDLIVSNPPYIPVKDLAGLQVEVRDFEPHLALTDGAGGLSIIEKIIRQSPPFLKPGGSLVLEIGINQSEAVNNMFTPKTWTDIHFVPDFQGISRMVYAELI